MTPTENTTPFNVRQIDALVDGELDERQRCELLGRCEQSPEGWRTLALAFLEAQTWRTALTTVEVAKPIRHEVAPAGRVSSNDRSRTLVWIGACAVSALLAFSLGLSGSGLVRRSPSLADAPPTVVPIANATKPADAQAAVAQTLTPAVRLQLERLGFRIQERPRVVSVKRSDGETVQVLVNEVELRYVGLPFSL